MAKKATRKKSSSYQTKKKRVEKKRRLLYEYFPEVGERNGRGFLISNVKIDKITFKDIENQNFEKYTFLNFLDFDKVFTLPHGMAYRLSYRDFTCETTLNELLKRFQKYSNSDLQKFLEAIINRQSTYDPDTYKKTKGKSGGSSGKAGKANFRVSNILELQAEKNEERRKNNQSRKRNKKRIMEGKKPLFQHEGQYDYWQELRKDKSPFIQSFTPRELLIISNAMMYNITEESRPIFYSSLYYDTCLLIPELKKYLPRPN